ncbi:LysR family transcriptional regulator [Arthrobacter sp. MI7-26]|uniref:LysR family transcriptional regulator n=1 Tax=Arthrobacter sp. MI7-26 TaxID=2993653 RepID=UPI002248B6B8|nr:LysR family transcriptional regulator [Arthrobacter sp. MI7-26]MCX2750454.1 LysR family transcriptional regulator [Arthrobacter sp. MI7-26]
MDIKQLTALVTVAEVGSVTRAARLLHLVQPAVSRQIRTLEDELGVPLFERTQQGMVTTPMGEVMVERARRALLELNRAVAEVRPKSGRITGIVSVGVLESLIDLIPEQLVAVMSKSHPGIQLRILTAYSGSLQQWLDSGDVDVSLLYNLGDTRSLAIYPLVKEQLWAIAPPDAGLDLHPSVTWNTVFEQTLVLPIAGHGLRGLIDQARSACLRGLINETRSGAERMPTISIETDSLHVQKQMVLAGHGWTILPPAAVISEVRRGIFSGAPLVEPVISRSIVLGLQRSARISAPVEAVVTELTRLVRQLVRSGEWPSTRSAKS